MRERDIQSMCVTGIKVGLGVALIPATITGLIASSRIIVINIIANTIVRVLTANAYRATVYGLSFIAVPLLWKISLVTAITGGTIILLSMIAFLVNALYQRYARSPNLP